MFKLEKERTCCMCCGIPLINDKHFMKEDGTLVKKTRDHILLHSLGGMNSLNNIAIMCLECNQLRSNLFAELDEFLFWYWSDEVLPSTPNFSYLNSCTSQIEKRIKEHVSTFNLESSESKLIGTVTLNGFVYNQYEHPVFGKSMVKVK